MASVRAQVLCYLMRKPGVENLKGVAMFGGDLALSQINAPSVSRNEPHPLIDLNVKVRVLVVDDHPLLRAGVAAVLDGKSDLTIVGEASGGREAIERFQALQPDVTVMDLQMPGMSGIDAMRAIRLKSPTARIVVLTTFSGDVLAQRALKAGASAYVLKERVRAELADIIRAVHRGMKHIEPAIALQIAHHACDLTLTSREVEVLQRVAAGNSNKLIAKALTISEETAKTYVKSIVEKLGAHNRTHAVTIGLHRGIIELS
jgi:DNA-binding NarL/FixJ family response regulator